MGKSKNLAKTAKAAQKSAQKNAKDLSKKTAQYRKRMAKGHKGLAQADRLSLLKKAVFVAGVLAVLAVRAKNRKA